MRLFSARLDIVSYSPLGDIIVETYMLQKVEQLVEAKVKQAMRSMKTKIKDES